MKKLISLLLAALLVLSLAGCGSSKTETAAPASSGAGDYPANTITLYCGYSAGGGNTDTIMVGRLDGINGTLDVLSIYRDTLVDVPWEVKKINSVYNFQGIEGLQEQVKNLVGFQPDYYIVMEMDAVARIVNALGGVDYDVPYNMHYDDPSQDLHIHFEKGEQHLNGEDTVKVLRWRKNNSGESLSVGDVGRVEIQHDLMKTLAEQAISLENLGKESFSLFQLS